MIMGERVTKYVDFSCPHATFMEKVSLSPQKSHPTYKHGTILVDILVLAIG